MEQRASCAALLQQPSPNNAGAMHDAVEGRASASKHAAEYLTCDAQDMRRRGRGGAKSCQSCSEVSRSARCRGWQGGGCSPDATNTHTKHKHTHTHTQNTNTHTHTNTHKTHTHTHTHTFTHAHLRTHTQARVQRVLEGIEGTHRGARCAALHNKTTKQHSGRAPTETAARRAAARTNCRRAARRRRRAG